MKLCYLDFEFRNVSEPKLDLVSVAVRCTVDQEDKYIREFWLHNNPAAKSQARKFFANLIADGYVFVAYVMEAEARSLMTLFGDDRSWLRGFKAIDLYLEYRCLLNHNDSLSYGEQYIDGKIIKTSKPPNKWERADDEPDDEAHHKPSYSLAAATFKLLGEKIDTDEKNEVRDIIIYGKPEDVDANMDRIQRYNMSDIKHLQGLLAAVIKRHKDHGETLDGFISAALKRGDYAVRTARMVELGYPVNIDKVTKFTANVKGIVNEAIQDCLEFSAEVESFRFDKRKQAYVACEKNIREWIKAQSKPYWRKTAKSALSISKDAFSDWYDSQSEGFAGAYCRYLKTKQSLNGFSGTASKRGKFTDFIGSDNRVRPFFGIYGSQSSRSQPGATAFIPLKAHWLRNFIEADAGRALAGVDYASQEFLIAAIISQDEKMMAAYRSGDVYLAFAKEAGLVPQDATKQSHKKMRDACKTLVLGISYDISSRGLAPRMSQALGSEVTEEQAQAYIDKFFEVYSDYKAWKDETIDDYVQQGFLQLPDGWTLFGDNSNKRSVGNFPIQGHGAVIMREAVRRAQNCGLDIIYTLHDALYIEFKSDKYHDILMLKQSMSEAFEAVMSQYGKTVPIKLEGEAWSKDYAVATPMAIEGIEYLTEYVDDKGRKDLERYRKYFS